MSDEPDPERVRAAVQTLVAEFDHPDTLELYCYQYNGDSHINFHCPDPPAAVTESPDDRYRLEPVEFSGTETWTLQPVEIPRAFQ
jgi:hypothetical protein